jgi:adenosylmethionine-8-amino-7-oxononanoate aminotransferase
VSQVFARGSGLPTVARASGCELWDTEGRRYLDGAGGAIVVGIGHGDASVAEAIADQAGRVAYAHGTMFTSEALEAYAAELAGLVPVDDARTYPVSGGSEAIETALKMARAYHLARGEDRHRVIGRRGSYHGNTRGALDAGGREPLRRPYLPWLGLAGHTLAAYEYRCPFPDTHPVGCGGRYAEALEQEILASGPGTVAAFVAEPVAGAGLGAAVPPDDYWAAVTEVCRRHGVLLIADEVMTGFGRTGRWFACDHWAVRPDILVLAKGAASGYWPLGLAVASGEVHDTIGEGGFTHGLTYSHHVVGAAAGRAVLRVLRERRLVEAAETRGKRLRAGLEARLAGHPAAGDIRGRGLLVAVELGADRVTSCLL